MKYIRNSCFVLLFFGILFPAFGKEQSENVINMNKKWNFTWVGSIYFDLYSYKNSLLLCVRTHSNQYALWNPLNDTLALRFTHKCHPGHGLRRADPEIRGVKVGGTMDGSHRLFSYNNTITYSDGHEGTFYIFGRLKSSHPQDKNQDGKDGTFSQAFDEIVVNSMTLEDGSVLFVADSYAYYGMCSACRGEFAQPTLLRFKDVPTTIPSLGKDTFVVPSALLDPVFNNQKANNFARYLAVMKVIGNLS